MYKKAFFILISIILFLMISSCENFEKSDYPPSIKWNNALYYIQDDEFTNKNMSLDDFNIDNSIGSIKTINENKMPTNNGEANIFYTNDKIYGLKDKSDKSQILVKSENKFYLGIIK